MNPHGTKYHEILSLARLPVPPLRHKDLAYHVGPIGMYLYNYRVKMRLTRHATARTATLKTHQGSFLVQFLCPAIEKWKF